MKKIAYIMSRFPNLTETFVLNEIVAEADAGSGRPRGASHEPHTTLFQNPQVQRPTPPATHQLQRRLAARDAEVPDRLGALLPHAQLFKIKPP